MIERVNPAARVPPHVALLEEIARRRSTPAVAFSGLGPVLDMLAAYIVATESRIDALESARATLASNVLRLDGAKDVRRDEIEPLL